ncbi:hypothetical protein ACFL13_01830 [Patescibacteria group bacterium]
MASKTLLKLIDQAILPAVILLCTRIVTIILLSYFFKISISISTSGFIFENPGDYILVNSYSLLAMVMLLSLGLLYVLIKAMFFHNTHITPFLTARLFSLKLSTFIQSSYEIYSQAFIWLMYIYLLTLLTWIFALFEHAHNYVFYISLLFSVVSTVFFIIDIEDELGLKSKVSIYMEDKS